MDGNAEAYLAQLAVELKSRSWRVRLLQGEQPTLKVTNPDAVNLSDVIHCHPAAAGLEFRWSWDDPIGGVDAVAEVADRITQVLRVIGAESR